MADTLQAIDFHTHDPAEGAIPDADCLRIVSTALNDFPQNDPAGTFRTLELHPWYGEPFSERFAEMAKSARVIAVGEVGLDKNKGKRLLPEQREIFRQCVRLADEIEKPLIIHCVGCFSELLEEYKLCPWHVPTVLHYFCGKPELAEQLLTGRDKWYLSLPPLATKSARLMELLKVDAAMRERIVLETDDPAGGIEAHYTAMSEVLAWDLSEMKRAMHQRMQEIFKV